MRNCIILGSGRSGTSMVAGTLAGAGYFMGENLHMARESNPKGFFESADVNRINEKLLAPLVPSRPPFFGRWFFKDRPLRGQRWLACLSLGTKFEVSLDNQLSIQNITSREPFCFKDPRFSYTLPAWRPFLRNTSYICVFRDPASTAQSILKEIATMPYLSTISLSFRRALEVWKLMYQQILEIHSKNGNWLFLHYNQVLDELGLDRLEKFLCSSVDRTFPENTLRRTISTSSVPKRVKYIYQQLCTYANYTEE